MNLKRISRLLKLLQTLQAGNGKDADGLAAACGVSRRTFFRDLETLRAAGVPLEFDDEHNRYSIAGEFFLPPTNFTAEEALAVIVLTSKYAGVGRLPFLEPAQRAALKLESNLPGPLRDELRSVTRSIQINVPQVNPLVNKQECYQQLVDAIAGRHVVRINYQSLTEWETITTKLRPYQLLFSLRSWYVIGRSSLHKDTRTFNLSRITEAIPLKERYVIPKSFSLEKHLKNAWHLIPDEGPDQEVVVRFQPLVARNVAEVVWHKTQELLWREDGSLDFHARVSGLNEISWWILGYGDQAEVLQPLKLRRLVARRVENLHRLYAGCM
jgi:proteasome accessory factor B